MYGTYTVIGVTGVGLKWKVGGELSDKVLARSAKEPGCI